MIFYLVMGGLFALYGLDLLLLTVVSAIARTHEIAALLKERRVHRKQHGSSKHIKNKGVETGDEVGKEESGKAAAETQPPSKQQQLEGKPPNLPDLKLPASLEAEEGAGDECSEGPTAARPEPSERSSCESPTTPTPANPEPKPLQPTSKGLRRDSSSSSGVRDEGAKEGEGEIEGDSQHDESEGGGEQERHSAEGKQQQEKQEASSSAGSVHSNRHAEDDAHSNGKQSSSAQAPPPAAPSPVPVPTRASNVHGKASTNHSSSLFSMGSSGGSSSYSVDSVELAKPGKAVAVHPLKQQQLQHSRSVSEISGSSAGVWERGVGAGGVVAAPIPNSKFPLVLIQLPMFNEEAHAGLIIERVCAIAWPRDRLLIQVLDDSTKAHVRDIVDDHAAKCMEAGHPVQVKRRTNRQGYKAGAMVEGLEEALKFGFKYVAIFDADFEPPHDFLEEAIGPLEENPRLGFVQTRWLCPADSFLTWNQKINLGFHFDVEQRARSYLGWFFNFNGTAGVWRIETIQSSGGWQSDTVVEDMDLSLRAYLNGWGALYLPHVASPNEVPGSLSAYRTQQFRWLSGPMQIIVKAFFTIWSAKDIGFLKRMNCYWFFARYIVFALITLAVLLVPPVAMWLDPWVWEWYTIFFCASVNFALAVYLYITPFSIAYLVFSVAVGYYKTFAMLSGLVGSKQSKKWKVTQKTGAVVADGEGKKRGLRGCMSRFWLRLRSIQPPYALEMGLMAYYGFMAGMGFWIGNWLMGGYCAIMGTIFLVLAWGDEFM